MNVLIADDNIDFARSIEDIVRSFGHETHLTHDPHVTINHIDKSNRNIGLILLDIEFGPGVKLNGLDVLEYIRKNYPVLPVVMISGKGTIEYAVRATKLGAINFIEKSLVNKPKLKEVLESAMSRYDTPSEADDILRFLRSNGMHGLSKSLVEIGDSIIRFGRTDLNVLITGETGTGKKLVAKALHNVSRRIKNPFVTVDIPNIPKDLFQSELFGHNKGSFSGATDTKKGLFHKANRGTLFLDEIGDLSLDLQSNLFIPIEEKVVRKVGSIESEDVDIRFVSATDRDLVAAMNDGRFREQLYHRLRECEIYIAPLRERPEDIPLIADCYLKLHNQDFNESKIFSAGVYDYLQEQPWSGNVRELSSVLRVALQTTANSELEVHDLHKLLTNNKSQQDHHSGTSPIISNTRTLKEDIEITDKRKIEATLDKCRGNVSKSAAMLDISRETLHNKIRKYEIDVQHYREKKKKK